MPTPRSASRERVYYGWAVLLVAAAAMVGTLPGRTQGLGLVTEPLLADLGLDRLSYAQLNFWATIIGSVGALGIGRLLDRLGSRTVLTAISLALGAVVCLMSQSQTVTGLAVWMTLTRGLGQGALSVVSLAMVGHWFVRRINTAMAIFSIVMSIGFMIAFPAVGWAIQRWGWRRAWMAIGIVLIGVLAPIALSVVRRTPESRGLVPDGVPGAMTPPAQLEGYSWRHAIASPAFWVFAMGTALYGLIASGIGLFNESILAERGFGPEIYYQTLAVTAMTALAGNLVGGWLAGRIRLGVLLAISLGLLTLGLLVLPHVSLGWHVMAWAAAMGAGGGLVMVLFFSVWPRVFGRRELGRIQGTAQALTVLASALGPLLLASCIEWTGSYAAMFRLLAGVIAVTAACALMVPVPPPAPPMRATRALHTAETTR